MIFLLSWLFYCFLGVYFFLRSKNIELTADTREFEDICHAPGIAWQKEGLPRMANMMYSEIANNKTYNWD